MSEQHVSTVKNWLIKYKLACAIAGAIILILIGVGVGIGVKSGGNKEPADNSVTDNTSSQGTIPVSQSPSSTPATVTPKTYTGTGDDVVTLDKPTNSPAILKFDCPGCTENTVVKANGADTLLVNTIGSYSGSHLIDTAVGSNTTQITITATGAWTLSLSGLDQATQVNGQATSGQGDSVLYVTGDTTAAAFTNTGDENFVVKVYPADGGSTDLAINTIGSYSGTVPLSTPSYVQITSNGSWSITPQ